MITKIIATLLLFPAFASANTQALTGKLTGHCVELKSTNQVTEATRVLDFEVLPGEKQEWGFRLPPHNDYYKVVVLNNTQTAFEKEGTHYSASLAIAHDGQRVSSDMPLLCPTSPKDKREVCLEHNRKISARTFANSEMFEKIQNNGNDGALLNSRRNPSDGKIKFWWMRSSLFQSNLQNGEFEVAIDFKNVHGGVQCFGDFHSTR